MNSEKFRKILENLKIAAQKMTLIWNLKKIKIKFQIWLFGNRRILRNSDSDGKNDVEFQTVAKRRFAGDRRIDERKTFDFNRVQYGRLAFNSGGDRKTGKGQRLGFDRDRSGFCSAFLRRFSGFGTKKNKIFFIKFLFYWRKKMKFLNKKKEKRKKIWRKKKLNFKFF